MAQHDYIIANQSGAAFRSDLNNGLAAIVSQNSGAAQPSTTYAYQWWADTTTGLLKIRNAANNAWITLFQLDGEWTTLALENGTAAAPSLYFKDSGTDTGLFSPGANQLAISTGGVQRLLADASGNLTASGGLTVANLNGGPLAGFRNRIINGNFDIWQRGTSFTTGFGADRWNNADSGTTHAVTRQAFTLGQTAVPNEPRYFNRTVVTSVAGAGNLSQLLQPIEDVRTFAGQQVTVSFWAKVDSTKNIAVELAQDFGTGGSPSSQVRAIGTTKVSIGTSWQKVTVTATVPSISGKTLGTNGNSFLALVFWFDAGSTWNTSTDSLGQQSGTFDIAQVQIEPGPVATPFEQRPIGTELALCRRYYEEVDGEFRHDGTLGGTNISVGHTWFATVPKRTTATVSVLSESGSNVSNILAVTAKGVNGAFCRWEYTSGTSIITRNKAAIIKFVAEL